MKSRLFTSGALCANAMLLAFAFPSGVASAQEAVSEKSDEIVVTARKRAESLQDVPASLTVVGASEATARGAVRVRDLEAATPNVLFTGTENNSLTRVSVRGLESQARQNVGTESGLGYPARAIRREGTDPQEEYRGRFPIDAARERFGFEPRVGLPDGLRRTARAWGWA